MLAAPRRVFNLGPARHVDGGEGLRPPVPRSLLVSPRNRRRHRVRPGGIVPRETRHAASIARGSRRGLSCSSSAGWRDIGQWVCRERVGRRGHGASHRTCRRAMEWWRHDVQAGMTSTGPQNNRRSWVGWLGGQAQSRSWPCFDSKTPASSAWLGPTLYSVKEPSAFRR